MLKRLALFFAMLLVVGGAVVFAAGWVLAKPVPAKIGPAPSDLGAEDVHFPSESGTEVHGWWCPVPQARGSILLLPGVRANRLSMIARARFLRGAGFSVLLIDLQATGETLGEHITFGWQEGRDARAAVDFIHATAPGERVGVIGSSLGGAAALLAIPPLPVDAMVLELVYPTVQQATRNRLRKYLGKGGGWLAPILLAETRFLIGVSPAQLRPVDRIGAISCPILIINGEDDRNTTREDAEALFARAGPGKVMWLIPKAGHVDLHRAAGGEYETRVLGFLLRTMQRD